MFKKPGEVLARIQRALAKVSEAEPRAAGDAPKASRPRARALARTKGRHGMRAEYDFSKGKRGAVIPQKGKTRISIFIDNAVLDAFRARAERAGTGYQTMMNEALRRYLTETEQPVTERVLRHVLRQEIPEYLRSLSPRSTRPRSKSGTRR